MFRAFIRERDCVNREFTLKDENIAVIDNRTVF